MRARTVCERVTAKSKSQNTLLVLTTDHGDSFERGFLNHGEDLYENSIHVPLVIKFPGQRKGERLFFPVQSIDIAPTIVETAGIAVPNVDGRRFSDQTGRAR